MENKFILKKCTKCGALVEVLKDCACENCGIKCCGQEMEVIKENSVDCSVEKHLPNYKVVGNYIVVTVNHVMEEDHFIEYLAIEASNLSAKKFLKPNEEVIAVFPYIKGSKILSYCNKHGLWSTIIE